MAFKEEEDGIDEEYNMKILSLQPSVRREDEAKTMFGNLNILANDKQNSIPKYNFYTGPYGNEIPSSYSFNADTKSFNHQSFNTGSTSITSSSIAFFKSLTSNLVMSSGTATSTVASEPDEETTVGLINYAKKGLDTARENVKNVMNKEGTKNILSKTQSIFYVNSNQSSISPSFFDLSSSRLIFFAIAVTLGTMCFALSFLLFPTIVFAPSKFAFLFTMGSVCWVVSFGFLRGFTNLFYHIMSLERLPFSLAYTISLLSTLYATIIKQSYFLALISSLIQICALLFFLMSYIPGGKMALIFLGKGILGTLKNALKCGSARSLSLPI